MSNRKLPYINGLDAALKVNLISVASLLQVSDENSQASHPAEGSRRPAVPGELRGKRDQELFLLPAHYPGFCPVLLQCMHL